MSYGFRVRARVMSYEFGVTGLRGEHSREGNEEASNNPTLGLKSPTRRYTLVKPYSS